MKKGILLCVIVLLAFGQPFPSGHAQCLSDFRQVDVGSYNTLAIKSDGTLWSWGLQVMKKPIKSIDIRSTPTQIGDRTDWKSLATANSDHRDTTAASFAITANGELWIWGFPRFDSTRSEYPIMPLQKRPDLKWEVVDGCVASGMAISSDGKMWLVNRGETYQLGADSTWKFVNCGPNTQHAIKKDGSLWGMGGGRSYQIGNGGDYDQEDFVPIAPGKKWRMSVDGYYCSFAITENGELWGWGRNHFDVMGSGGAWSYVPMRIGTDSNWVSVDVGTRHTVGMTSDGKIWTWGDNAEGQLGDGTNIGRNVPTQIGKNEKWKAISASGYRTVAITEDGRCWAWGRNDFILDRGILGDGTNVGRKTPVLVGNFSLNDSSSTAVTEHSDVSYAFDENCNRLAKIESSGASPVAGSITTKVWVEGLQPETYVKRHYEITPSANAASATGRVTLYFTQEEFNQFNAVNPVMLPTNKTDLAGLGNLLIEKRSGASSDGTGHPATYGEAETINPIDTNIVWNEDAGQWEITFDVTGFSGFFVKTDPRPLPVNWLSVNAYLNNENRVAIEWKVVETSVLSYEIQRSTNARNFVAIARLGGIGDGLHTYNVSDPEPLSANTYYRIKQTDLDGSVSFSKIVVVNRKPDMQQLAIYPVPAKNSLVIDATAVQTPDMLATFIHTNGKLVKSMELHAGKNEIDISDFAPGMYIIVSGEQSYKFVKE